MGRRSQTRHTTSRARSGHRAQRDLRGGQRDHEALPGSARCRIDAAARRVARRRGCRGQSRHPREAAACPAGGHRQPLPVGPRKDRRRPGEGRRHRRWRAGRGRRAGSACRRQCASTRRRYRPHTTAGVYVAHRSDRRIAMAAAQTLADDHRSAVPSRPAAVVDERGLGARLQRDQGAGWQGKQRAAAPSRPRSRASGTIRCRRSTTASCVRWPTSLGGMRCATHASLRP